MTIPVENITRESVNSYKVRFNMYIPRQEGQYLNLIKKCQFL